MMPKFKEPIVFFDIDDTLVSWNFYNKDANSIPFNFNGQTVYLKTIQENIQALKNHKLRGHTVIVWSASGADWAEAIVDKLRLQPYVDAVMAKPNWFYDDVPASTFMPDVIRKYGNYSIVKE